MSRGLAMTKGELKMERLTMDEYIERAVVIPALKEGVDHDQQSTNRDEG